MANIVDVFRRLISPYYYYIISIIVLIIFLSVTYYAYYNIYKKSEPNKFKNVANANRRNKEVTIFFFHVDWCPHCKKALPEWNTFKAQNNGKQVNGYLVKCVDLNCTNETSDITRAINEYNIDSYPTVKMLKENQKIEFDSKITSTALDSFVITMLND
jgi:thiol-disulfide isomerase/thioredoxin